MRYYRELRNLSQEELGNKIGYSRFGILNLEKGFNPIYYEEALRLGSVLHVQPEVFLDEYTMFCKPGYGLRIKKIREAYKQSQKDFSSKLGVSRCNLAVWECEFNNRHPKIEVYKRLKVLADEKGIIL